MKEHSYPPDEPTDGSKWLKRTAVFLAIVFCAYQFGFKPIVDDYRQKNQWDVVYPSEGAKIRLLRPGYHIVSSFPFIVIIDDGEVGVEEGDGSIRRVPITEIPFNHVGVITDKRRKYVNPKVLKPGRYYINPDLYKVDEVFTGEHTIQFGGAKDD